MKLGLARQITTLLYSLLPGIDQYYILFSLELADVEDNPLVLQWLETAGLRKSDMSDLVQYLSARIKL